MFSCSNFKRVWLRHPQLSLFFHVDSILVDRQKEVIHRIANLFSQGKRPLHWIHPLALCRHDWTTGLSLSSEACQSFQSPAFHRWPIGIKPSRILNPIKSNVFPVGRLALLSRITFVSTNNSIHPLVSPFGRLAKHYRFRDLTFREIANLFCFFITITNTLP